MKNIIFSLSKNKDFKLILGGKKISNKYSTIFYKKLPNKKDNVLNLSFVVKKKVGKAVMRNKIKRRLRNIMNDISKKIKLNLKYSYVVIAKKNVVTAPYLEIKNELIKKFSTIK